MADNTNSTVFEFMSKCWVPFIASEHRLYYACGNTRMNDFLRDFKVNREMDILVLGLGDVRHVMATVAGLSQRPPSSAGQIKEIHFHLNDEDPHVIARDVILLEIMNKLDPENRSDAEFLWSIWYNAFIVKKDFKRFKTVLGELIDKYSNSSREYERICKFGDTQSLKSVLKTWNCWLNRKLNQSAVKQSRLKSFECAGYTMLFNERNIAQYASMQTCIDRGIKESDVDTVGREMLTVAIDGFVNISEDRKVRKDFVNPTMMRPGCEEWLVENGAHAAASYLPLRRECFDEHSTIHGACFEEMRTTISSYLESWKLTKVTYTFWATDLFHLCHSLLPSDKTFDFIFTSNLLDHVGLLNLLLITQPRLKMSESILLTESHNWNEIYDTLGEFLKRELRCNCMLLPSMVGLKLAEDLNLGTPNLQGFYRTMYGRQSDTESIYWTKSLNQENITIDLEGSPQIQEALLLLMLSTFWSKRTTQSASSLRQTPLALMFCLQRLQHLVSGGMATLLDFVELALNNQSTDISRNWITWDVVCWTFGLKHDGGQLCIVKMPSKDVSSRLDALKKHCKLNCRLRLEYNNSSKKEEVLSLFQYDAVGQHFQIPILESAWKALPVDATISVIDSDSDKSPSSLGLQNLGDQKLAIKRVGKVTATYSQPKHTDVDVAASNSDKVITCYEDADNYRLPKAYGAETRASFDLLCQLIVSAGSKNNTGLERADVDLPYKFSCAVDSYEIKDVDENHIQAILYKQKSFNMGRATLPYRLIDDSELVPFASGQEIKTYLEETMICDLMFCSPTDIESRAKAFRGSVLTNADAFMVLRLITEQLWQLGSKKDQIMQHTLQLEIQDSRKTSEVLILDVEGYYRYYGLPLVRMRSIELERNSVALNASNDTTKIFAKDRKCYDLLKEMLFTNSLRMHQQRPASVKPKALSVQSMNTFLQMTFPKESGEDMTSALHAYPTNIDVVKNYIEKIYSARIRQNFVARVKALRMMKQQMMKMLSSFSTTTVQFPSGNSKSAESTTPRHSSGHPLEKQIFCSECKKSATDLMKCSRCKSVAYCSKPCQVKNWPEHKKECSSSASSGSNDVSTTKENRPESACLKHPSNVDGSSMKPTIQGSLSDESRIKDAPSNEKKKIESDPLAEGKIDDCSSARSLSEGRATLEVTKRGIAEEGSALYSDNYISKSKNDDGGVFTETKNENSRMATCNTGSYLESVIEDDTKEDNASIQLKYHQPVEKRNETGSEDPIQQYLREIKDKDETDATPGDSSSVHPRSSGSCTYCCLENTNLKKCTNCKSAAYCNRECQGADWKRHKPECRTQQLPNAQPLMNSCSSCGVHGKETKKCSRCKNISYCSVECQRRDFKNHKTACRLP